jgi:glycosyltransferase involved in cell wall biosynthesis
VIPAIAETYEIILVNDGSSDDTWSRIQEIERKYPEVRGVDAPAHLGKGGALTLGLARSMGKIAGFIDADLEIDPGYLIGLANCVRKGSDVAIGSKIVGAEAGRNRSFTRQLSTRIYNTMVRVILNSVVQDHQAGIKVFRRTVLDQILPRMKSQGWIWDTEFLVRAQSSGFRISELPISISRQRVSKVNVPLDAARMFLGVLRLCLRGLRVPRRTKVLYEIVNG